MKRFLLVVLFTCFMSGRAFAGEWLVSYVYHTASHDGVAGYGYTIVQAKAVTPRLLEKLWAKQMKEESKVQPESRGKLVSLSFIAVSKLK